MRGVGRKVELTLYPGFDSVLAHQIADRALAAIDAVDDESLVDPPVTIGPSNTRVYLLYLLNNLAQIFTTTGSFALLAILLNSVVERVVVYPQLPGHLRHTHVAALGQSPGLLLSEKKGQSTRLC